MRPIAFAFILSVGMLSAGLARAQNVTVEGVAVSEYGLYASDPTGTAYDEKGIAHAQGNRPHLTATTHTVPLRPHVMFGFQYRINGAPAGAAIPIREVVIFPPGGLHPPGRQPELQEADDAVARIGATQPLTWAFDDSWELVPGLWTLQVWSGDRKLVEQAFTVTAR
jgi:uncharacterized protein DUF3859